MMVVLEGESKDSSKLKYSQLLLGAFKLLIYTLNYSSSKYDYELIFGILLREFLFNKKTRRIKHETTLKLLYECIKKLMFTEQGLIGMLIGEVAPQLRCN